MDICQINPLVASDSAVSSGIVKAGLAMQRTLGGSLSPSGLGSLPQTAGTKN